MEKLEESPLGWEVDLLYLFLHATEKLSEDIDMLIKNKYGTGLKPEKKKALMHYRSCMEDAERWLEKFGITTDTFEAVNEHSGMYSNAIASANELIRIAMLHIDRSHCAGGSYRAFKALRALPSNGIFPDKWIDRFQMKYEVVPEVGDRIKSDIHGFGTLQFNTCGKNWAVELDNGEQIILSEKQFKLL